MSINLLFLSVVGEKRRRAPIPWEEKIIGSCVNVQYNDGVYRGTIFQFLKKKKVHCIKYDNGEYGFIKMNKDSNLNITLNPTNHGEEMTNTVVYEMASHEKVIFVG